MKQYDKNIKGVRGKYNRKPSVSRLADEYYGDAFTDRHRRRLFRKELEKKFGHHLTLVKLLERRGHRRGKPLTPSMTDVIAKRIGDP